MLARFRRQSSLVDRRLTPELAAEFPRYFLSLLLIIMLWSENLVAGWYSPLSAYTFNNQISGIFIYHLCSIFETKGVACDET